ncbi:unnamed protein product [Phytophthora lilii]|uniref:Unnamed protein product n=1 Tax=Phytophthora lilii TaxID=2077276 RepID=A0A9W6U048_9STRA|nr:unnamed protein product [Phytophthora lilii]
MMLNRFYLVLLVVNSLSSVFIYALMFNGNEARKRFACLVSDCVLDLVSCTGVPLIVMLSYINDYDIQLSGFPLEYWYDDVWSARALNEFQIVLVVSWSDLLSRTIFSFGLVITTSNLKDLLKVDPGEGKKRSIGAFTSAKISVKSTSFKAIRTIVGVELAGEYFNLVRVGSDSYSTLSRRPTVAALGSHEFRIMGCHCAGFLHIQASVNPSYHSALCKYIHGRFQSQPAT